MGPKSLLRQIKTVVSYNIASNYRFAQNKMDNDKMVYIQWQSLDVLTNAKNFIVAGIAPMISSFKDLDPENVYSNPEFAYFV